MTRDLLVVHATRRAARLIALLPMLVALLAVGCGSETGKRPPRAAGPAPGPVLHLQLDADIDSADPALDIYLRADRFRLGRSLLRCSLRA